MGSWEAFRLHQCLLLLQLFIPLCLALAQTGQYELEEKALLDFRDALEDYKEGTFATWNPAQFPNHCFWEGVGCDRMSSVTRIEIEQQGLTGSLSESLGSLKQLVQLDFHRNSLFGSIPTAIAALPALGNVKLSLNNFTGPIPKEFGRGNLRRLLLYTNSFSGSIPSSLSASVNLRELRLSENNLTGSLPDFFSLLTDLRVLALRKNSFEGSIPSGIGQLKDLFSLSLDFNQLSGLLPSTLWQCASLRNLTLMANSISGSIPSDISNLSNLRIFNVSRNLLSGPLPTSLPTLKSLNRLDVSANNFSGLLPENLGSIVNLSRVDVSSNRGLSGPIPSSFADLKFLEYLNMSHGNFSGPLPNFIFTSLKLSDFDFADNILGGDLPPPAAAEYKEANWSDARYFNNCFVSNLSDNDPCFTPTNGICFLPNQRPVPTCVIPLTAGAAPQPIWRWVVLFCFIFVVMIAAVIAVILRAIHDRKRREKLPSSGASPPAAAKVKPESKDEEAADTRVRDTFLPGMPAYIKRYAMDDVKAASQHFTKEVNPNDPLCFSYFGPIEGEHLCFRVLNSQNSYRLSKEEFVKRIRVLHSIQHSGMMPFRGYAYEDGRFIAVFKYTQYCLYEKLHDVQSRHKLSWGERMRVAVGVAASLDHIHRQFIAHELQVKAEDSGFTSESSEELEMKVAAVHGDVKSSNIWLTDAYRPKLAEFYLPRDDGPDPLTSIFARGSFGYLDPLYADVRKLTQASDVYSFGILLFELITGRHAMLEDSSTLIVWVQSFFLDRELYVKMLDPHLQATGSVPRDELEMVVEIAQECTQVDDESRPPISEVLQQLMDGLNMELDEALEPDANAEEHNNEAKKAEEARAGDIRIEMVDDEPRTASGRTQDDAVMY